MASIQSLPPLKDANTFIIIFFKIYRKTTMNYISDSMLFFPNVAIKKEEKDMHTQHNFKFFNNPAYSIY